MTIPPYDGCLWPLDLGCNEEAWESDFDEPTHLRAQALASATLRRLTAYRVGGCPVKVRPCGGSRGWQYVRMNAFVNGYPLGDPFIPSNWNGVWSNQCACAGPCGCGPAQGGVTLPRPVYSVTEVRLDGAALNEGTDYSVYQGTVFPLGGIVFPTIQDLSLPDTEVGTFSVTYFDSAQVDGSGAYAAGLLAFEYAKACKTGKCALPSTVTSVVRQGVSFTLPTGAFPNGETGMREVDAYIALWNPAHRPQRVQVWVP
jgi:hypothetical protein